MLVLRSSFLIKYYTHPVLVLGLATSEAPLVEPRIEQPALTLTVLAAAGRLGRLNIWEIYGT